MTSNLFLKEASSLGMGTKNSFLEVFSVGCPRLSKVMDCDLIA